MEMNPAAMGFDQRFKSDRVADSCRGNEGSLQPQVVVSLSQKHGVILDRPWKPRNDYCLDHSCQCQRDHFFDCRRTISSARRFSDPRAAKRLRRCWSLISGFMSRPLNPLGSWKNEKMTRVASSPCGSSSSEKPGRERRREMPKLSSSMM